MLSGDDLPEEQRWLLGDPRVNIAALLANSPGGFTRLRAVGEWILRESPLDRRLRELAIIQVGFTTRCAYEYAHHVENSMKIGVTPDDVRSIALESRGERSALGDLERALLAVARQITTDLQPRDEDFAVLAAALAPADLTDALIAISFYNAIVRLILTTGAELEERCQYILEQFPLPQDTAASGRPAPVRQPTTAPLGQTTTTSAELAAQP
jgi:alkylhydroperoxidase family enzyme